MLPSLFISFILPFVVLGKLGCPSPSLGLGTWVHKPKIGKCYGAMPGAVGSFDEGEAWCGRHGGHLSTPRDDDQVEAIASTAAQIHGHKISLKHLWVGFDTFEQDGKFQFANYGHPVKERGLIQQGENNRNKNKCCTAFKPGPETYRCLDCWEIHHFLCETSSTDFVGNHKFQKVQTVAQHRVYGEITSEPARSKTDRPFPVDESEPSSRTRTVLNRRRRNTLAKSRERNHGTGIQSQLPKRNIRSFIYDGWIQDQVKGQGWEWRIIDRKVDFFEAKTICSEWRGAFLPEPKYKDLNDALESLNITTQVWLGLSDRETEGKYLWETDGSNVTWFWSHPHYTNLLPWATDTTKNCVTMVNDETASTGTQRRDAWASRSCTEKHTVVCQHWGWGTRLDGSCKYISCAFSADYKHNMKCANSVCQCGDAYFRVGDDCKPRKPHGSACSTTQPCLDAFSCIKGICGCINLDTNYYEPNVELCLPRKQPYYNCRTTQECIITLTCHNGKCRCLGLATHYYDYITNVCKPRKPHGSTCSNRQRCLFGLICRNGKCSCFDLATYYYDTNTNSCEFRRPHGSTCSTTQQCLIDFTCQNGKCGCINPASHVYDTNTKSCVLKCPVRKYGPSCTDTCNCVTPTTCDLVSGVCPEGCQPWWRGDKCDAFVVHCPSGFTQHGGNCYKLFDYRLSHKAAAAKCNEFGAFLAEVKTKEQEKAIEAEIDNAIRPIYRVGYVWLGATDVVSEGTWVWMHSGDKLSNKSYSNWYPGWPTSRRNMNCMSMWYNNLTRERGWFDWPCSRPPREFICQTIAERKEDLHKLDTQNGAERPRHASLVELAELLIGTILTWAVGHVATGHHL